MAKKTKFPKTKVRVNFRLEPSMVQWMKKFAKKNKMTVTAVVERAIDHMEDKASGRA